MDPHYKIHYNGVTGVITPVSGVITIFITARCTSCVFFCYIIGTDQNLNRRYEIHLASGSRAVSLAGTTVYTLDVSCRDWVVISANTSCLTPFGHFGRPLAALKDDCIFLDCKTIKAPKSRWNWVKTVIPPTPILLFDGKKCGVQRPSGSSWQDVEESRPQVLQACGTRRCRDELLQSLKGTCWCRTFAITYQIGILRLLHGEWCESCETKFLKQNLAEFNIP